MSTSQNAVNPQHYKSHQSGIDLYEIRRHLTSNRGRCYIKIFVAAWTKRRSKSRVKKAIWYLNDESNYFAKVLLNIRRL